MKPFKTFVVNMLYLDVGLMSEISVMVSDVISFGTFKFFSGRLRRSDGALDLMCWLCFSLPLSPKYMNGDASLIDPFCYQKFNLEALGDYKSKIWSWKWLNFHQEYLSKSRLVKLFGSKI